MSPAGAALALWLVLTALIIVVPTLVGVVRIRSITANRSNNPESRSFSRCEVLVPLKGVFPNQMRILSSIVNQNHPAYQVMFILESDTDPGNEPVDLLCRQYPHARKVISGVSSKCAQKNHNLIAGISALRNDTETIVLCDSTNEADAGWLVRFTKPIDTRKADVVTTHRDFDPLPPNMGGVCQAIYGSMMLVLQWLITMPWGGGTAIRRETFEKLDVMERWATNVNDDMVLGNSLYKAGIGVKLDLKNRLRTPLYRQSVSGFLTFMDRQIINPKFTNPVIWLFIVVSVLNSLVNISTAMVLSALFCLGMVGAAIGWVSVACVAMFVVWSGLLRSIHPFPIPFLRWLATCFGGLFLGGFVCLRSIFRDYIVWHGRTYFAGRGGRVLGVKFHE